MNELTVKILEKLKADPELVLKKKIRGLPGITTHSLIQALLENETIALAAKALSYTDNPVKQAIRSFLGPVFEHRSHAFGDNSAKNMLSWRQELLSVIDYKFCTSCSKALPKNLFYSNKSRTDKISGYCKYCELSSSKLRKHYIVERTPMWADLEHIAEFYANCPNGYHVDHIIPLNGKTVSGLHVLSNLQYLTAEDNLKKNNKF